MRIISQDLVSYPFEHLIVFVDCNKVLCRFIGTAVNEVLGEYDSFARAEQVFCEINMHYEHVPILHDKDVAYRQRRFEMPEE